MIEGTDGRMTPTALSEYQISLQPSYNVAMETLVPSNISEDTVPYVYPNPPLYLLIYCTMFYVIIFISGIFGNLLVIYVIYRNPDMKVPTNFFLVNLSVADLLVILVCMPTALADIYSKEVWYLGPFMCRVVPFLENTVALSSMLTICAISFERYIAICHPFKAQYGCSSKRTLQITAAIWIISFVASAPFAVMTVYEEEAQNGEKIMSCTTYSNTVLAKVYVIFIYGVLFIVPLFALIVVYGVIGRKLVYESTRVRNENCSSTAKHRARKQAAIILFAVAAVFFSCLLPVRIVLLCSIFASEGMVHLGIEGYLNLIYSVRLLFYLNSSLNPLMYNIISTKFRRAFRRAFGCCKSCRKNPPPRKYPLWLHFSASSSSSDRHHGNSTHARTQERFMRYKACIPVGQNCKKFVRTDRSNDL